MMEQLNGGMAVKGIGHWENRHLACSQRTQASQPPSVGELLFVLNFVANFVGIDYAKKT